MGIVVYRTPQRRDDEVTVSIKQETLTINDTDFDLSGVVDPVSLACEFIVGDVFRLEGNVHVCVVAPYGLDDDVPDADDMPTPSMPDPPEPVVIVYPVDLWSRLTEAEANQVEAAMATQSTRVQNIFRSASSYRSDHELWPLLVSMATDLFGAPRAAEILAAS